MISEDIGAGSFIAYIVVIDPDSGQNGEVNCDLYRDKFRLQSPGVEEYKITVTDSLEWEIEGHSGIAIICRPNESLYMHNENCFRIQEVDANALKPQFSEKSYKFRIYEKQKSNFTSLGFDCAADPSP